jgi:putative ABC transport system substrate-binding protein
MGRQVKLIVTFGGTSPALAANTATAKIPIVFGAVSDDPVEAGLVSSLARPGSNVTGIVSLGAEKLGVSASDQSIEEVQRDVAPDAVLDAIEEDEH